MKQEVNNPQNLNPLMDFNVYNPRPYQRELTECILSGRNKRAFLCWARGAG